MNPEAVCDRSCRQHEVEYSSLFATDLTSQRKHKCHIDLPTLQNTLDHMERSFQGSLSIRERFLYELFV